MDDIVEFLFEQVVGIFVIITCVSLLTTLLLFMREPIIKVDGDKSFVLQEGGSNSRKINNIVKGSDILYIFMNSDFMAPYPKAIKVNNSPIIKLDAAFFAEQSLITSYVYVSGNGSGFELKNYMDVDFVQRFVPKTDSEPAYIHYVFAN